MVSTSAFPFSPSHRCPDTDGVGSSRVTSSRSSSQISSNVSVCAIYSTGGVMLTSLVLISGITSIDVDELKNSTQYVRSRLCRAISLTIAGWPVGKAVIPKSHGSGEHYDHSRKRSERDSSCSSRPLHEYHSEASPSSKEPREFSRSRSRR